MSLSGTVYKTGIYVVDNYDEIKNKPKINGVYVEGDKTAEDYGLVEKIEGYGLSKNDFTDDLKEQINGAIKSVIFNGIELENNDGVISFSVDLSPYIETDELNNVLTEYITSDEMAEIISEYCTTQAMQETEQKIIESIETLKAQINSETDEKIKEAIKSITIGDEVKY